MATVVVNQALTWDPACVASAATCSVGVKRTAAVAGLTVPQDLSRTAPHPRTTSYACSGCEKQARRPPADEEDDEACSSDESECAKVVAVRRYCFIFSEDVPESYFMSGEALADVDALVQTATAQLQAQGMSLMDHEYARGVEAYNVKAEEGEMWCNIPETCVQQVLEGLGDRVEDCFEEYGYDANGHDLDDESEDEEGDSEVEGP